MTQEHSMTIMGQKFVLKSTLEAAHVQLVAETVQELIDHIKGSGADLTDQSAAILAALNLAEQLVSHTISADLEPSGAV